MVKKSLGDLLREEAQKSLESEVVGTTERSQELVQKSPNTPNQATEQTIDVTATARPVDAGDESAVSDQSASEASESKKQALNAKATAKATEVKTAKTAAKTTDAEPESPDHKALEATIAKLKSGLTAAQKTEATLQEKITALQADLADQKALMQKLETEQKQTQKLKAELEDAKQTILKLTEAGSQAAKPEPAKQEPAKVKSSGLQLAKQPESQPRDYRSHKILLSEPIPQHSMHQHYPSKTTSDSDLGWFD